MALNPLSARARQIEAHEYVPEHTHPSATPTQGGFLSAEDKARLDASVRYDAAQSLTPTQRSQARGNLGIGDIASLSPTGTPSGTTFLAGDGVWRTPVISRMFESAEIAVTPLSSVTVAHGLGIVPKLVDYILICKSTELGYVTGDQLSISGTEISSAGASLGPLAVVTNNDVSMRFGNSPIIIIRRGSGDPAPITPASWRLKVRAFA